MRVKFRTTVGANAPRFGTHRRRCAPLRIGLGTAAVALLGVCGGCAQGPAGAGRDAVAAELRARTGQDFGDAAGAGDFTPLLSGAALSEERAVDLALLNNAAFQAQLADLGLARADLIAAGLLTNPDVQVLIPVGPKQLEATLTVPLELLWLRGPRMEAAGVASEQAAARLAQAGLDLVRDARLAYADLALARRRLALFEESARLRGRVAELARARVRAGETAALDEDAAHVDALRAEQDVRGLSGAAAIAAERLRHVLGSGAVRTPLVVDPVPAIAPGAWDVEALVAEALVGRPDARAAGLAVRAARARAALARFEWLNLSFIADANERGTKGFEASPGLRFTLPLFNRNQGAIARAEAEVERAVRQRRTLDDRAILEVREAHAWLSQAMDDLAAWRNGILPVLAEAVSLAERAYRGGQTPLVQVLDTNRELLEARVREAQAASDVRRALAQLERSVGRRLDGVAGAAIAPATGPTTRPALRLQTRDVTLPLAEPPATRPLVQQPVVTQPET